MINFLSDVIIGNYFTSWNFIKHCYFTIKLISNIFFQLLENLIMSFTFYLFIYFSIDFFYPDYAGARKEKMIFIVMYGWVDVHRCLYTAQTARLILINEVSLNSYQFCKRCWIYENSGP